MKLVTYLRDGRETLGALHGDKVLALAAAARELATGVLPQTMLELIAGGKSMLGIAQKTLAAAGSDRRAAGLWTPLASATLRAPLPNMRKNVFCVGRNYKAHIEEGARAHGREVTFPKVPEFFSKPPTTVIGNDEAIRLDARHTQQLDYEVELAIVIGAQCRDLGIGRALDPVFGYTIVNDVSARDAQKAHGQWFKGKSFDTFCPMGPCIVTADEFGDPSGHRLSLRVNGAIRQDSNTSDMLFDCPHILASLSAGVTLEPGDVIATGTPSGVALGMTPQLWLKDGDVVEAEVEGIGVLRNRVRAVT
jgi:2-keto-4-pentenoate hydratase/2-oxohepta-3-ene-1,7-dioic acid hydratase in catechol pathway